MSEAIQKQGLTREQIELVKSTVARNATDLELKMFLYQCERTGLDPLSRQIHFVKRGDQGTIQTGIDGYRVLADRTGECAGIDDAVFVEDSGHSWPVSATVTVYRLVQGQKCSFTATARWSEYFPSNEKQQFFWKKMPYGQLAKCAESLALRKAFPAQLSGVYTNEEMQQAGPEIVQIGDKVVEANTKEAAEAVRDEKLLIDKKLSGLKKEMQERKSIEALPEGEQVIRGVLSSVSKEMPTKTGKPFVSIEVSGYKMNIFDKAMFTAPKGEKSPLQKFLGIPVSVIVRKDGKYLNFVAMDKADVQIKDEDPPADDLLPLDDEERENMDIGI